MNLDSNPTINQLRQLVAQQQDDKYSHIVYVTEEGDVRIDRLADQLTPAQWETHNEENHQFRLETFHRGGDYMGLEASKSDGWMQRLMNVLMGCWQDKQVGYIDTF